MMILHIYSINLHHLIINILEIDTFFIIEYEYVWLPSWPNNSPTAKTSALPHTSIISVLLHLSRQETWYKAKSYKTQFIIVKNILEGQK